MKVSSGFAQIPLEDFDHWSPKLTQKCRDLVGFKEDKDWVCPYYKNREKGIKDFGPGAVHSNPDMPVYDTPVGDTLSVCYYCAVQQAHKQRDK